MRVWLYAGLILAAGGAAAAPVPVIPKAYQGTWYEADRACDDGDQYPLEVTASGLSSGEDSSDLISVRALGQGRIQVITKNYGELTADSPPGSDAYTGKSRTVLALSAKGQALKLVYQNGQSSNWKRCPAVQ